MKKIAFLFPGQGSQSLGMLADLAEAFPIVKTTFAQASAVLDYDLWQLVQQGPEQRLNQTEFTQPAILAASIAIWRVWQEQHGIIPAVVAGHSLGEYSALVCANAIDFADAISLVAERGRLMQAAVPEGQGGMAAIVGLDNEKVAALCAAVAEQEVLAPVNYNAIGQVVIAGHSAAVDRAIAQAKPHGAKLAMRLPVSVPSHCALMKPAADKLALKLRTIQFNTPEIPVIHNVDVKERQSAIAIQEILIAQLYNPVRWVETVQAIANRGITTSVECGPGKVLAGLNKRIIKDFITYNVETSAAIKQTLAELSGSVKVE